MVGPLEVGTAAWKESERLAALAKVAPRGAVHGPAFDSLVELAAQICDTSMAALNFVGEQQHWSAASFGIDLPESSRLYAYCAAAMLETKGLVVPDAQADPRFARDPLIADATELRFYAGVPIYSANMLPLGALCVLDGLPRPQGLTPRQQAGLLRLSQHASGLLQLWRETPQGSMAAGPPFASEDQGRVWMQTFEGVGVLDAQLRLRRLNPAAVRLLGGSMEALLGRPLFELLPAGPVQALCGRALEHDEAQTMTLNVPHPASDQPTTLHLRALPLGDGVAIFFRDVSAQQRAEQELRSNERRLAALSAQRMLGLAEIDEDGRISWVNDALSGLLGRPAHALLARHLVDLMHPDEAPAASRLMLQAHAAPEGSRRDLCYLRPDGAQVWADTQLIPILGVGARDRRQLACLIDISERKHAEQILRDGVGTVTNPRGRGWDVLPELMHELRNRLAPIRNALQVLRLGGHHDAVTTRMQDIAERQLRLVLELMDEVQVLTGLFRGDVRLSKRRLLLGDELARAMELSFQGQARESRQFTVSLPQEPLELEADPTYFPQALADLLRLAVQAAPARAGLHLQVRQEGAEAVFCISDCRDPSAQDLLEKRAWSQSPLKDARDPCLDRGNFQLTLLQQRLLQQGARLTVEREDREGGLRYLLRLPLMPNG